MGRIAQARACTFLVAAPRGTAEHFGTGFFDPLVADGRARLLEGETWDAMAHSNVTLAASGTVTIEAALLGAPMVTYYKVTPATWLLGRRLVRVPFFSMVNLVAGRKVVPELIQDDMTGETLAGKALELLNSPTETARMKADLAEVRRALDAGHCPFQESAGRILASIEKDAD